MLLLALACQPYAIPAGATAYDYAADALTTFPDDLHTRAEPSTPTGLAVDVQPEAEAWLEERVPPGYTALRALEALDGWGTTAAVTFRFTAPIDPASVTPANVRWLRDDGAEVAWHATFTDADATVLLHPRFPLDPATGYGVVAAGITDADGAPVWASADLHDVLRGKAEDPRLEALEDRYAAMLDLAEADPDAVVAATVFTTQSIHEGDAAVLAAIGTPSIVWDDCRPDEDRLRCDGVLTATDFVGETGWLDLPVGALPAPVRQYEIPVVLWLPTAVQAPFPVVIYGHGLGGDRDEAHGLSRDLGRIGVAVVAIDAPAHGDHPLPGTGDIFGILGFFGIDLDTGEFVVERLRDRWRQAAWDKVQLVAALNAGPDVDGDGQIDLDTARIGYSGLSLGGIMGSQLLVLAPEIAAADLSVPGGRVSDIVQHGDIFAPLIDVMRPDGVTDGDVDRFFPMLQTAIERGDAANYAPRVLDTDRDVLVQMVIDDGIVPNVTTEVLARAMGVEHAPPVLRPIEGVVESAPLPLSANVDGRTAVLFQFDLMDEDGALVPAEHGSVHGDEIGGLQVEHFWRTRLETGRAEVIDPYAELGIDR